MSSRKEKNALVKIDVPECVDNAVKQLTEYSWPR